jgi:hypothetical protein
MRRAHLYLEIYSWRVLRDYASNEVTPSCRGYTDGNVTEKYHGGRELVGVRDSYY